VLFASIDARDRKLLLLCLAAVVVLALLTGFFARNQNRDDNPLPSSYLTGKHGARAAYELLESSGYSLERWERPLSDLASQADAQTVVILAQPLFSGTDDIAAVKEILRRGGRVLATGMNGGNLLPSEAVTPPSQFQMAACKLTPQGLDSLAGSGEVWMVPAAGWKVASPRYRVQYNCAGEPAVVEYQQGAGHVVWWASSTPLENGSISRAQNLELFLNAIGTREGSHIYWDESLHGESHSQWFYARGPALNLLLAGLVALGSLTVFSFSRRSGPVRDLPQPPRTATVEFLDALGSLYAKAGASATAVDLAYERFRRKMGDLCGQNGLQMSAQELAAVLDHRFPQAAPGLESDLAACEEAGMDDTLAPRRALALVQSLNDHGKLFSSAARAKNPASEKQNPTDSRPSPLPSDGIKTKARRS
jgi:hypothetical protein